MSTRCRIGIENNDGTITSIYCHHDGYPERVGNLLREHYRDEVKIRKLLDLGDISRLGTEPIDNPNAWQNVPGDNIFFIENGYLKWFEANHPADMCDTYHSRGETCPAKTDDGVLEYVVTSSNCGGEYAYLFSQGRWYLIDAPYDIADGETEEINMILISEDE